jgi:hypothetical protein
LKKIADEISRPRNFDPGLCVAVVLKEEDFTMPVLLLWAVPAIVVVGGGIYLIGHIH